MSVHREVWSTQPVAGGGNDRETLCPAGAHNDDVITSDAVKCKSVRKPVIIDTDIGSFYDDQVAIALALSQPNLDVRLVVTCTNDTWMRAQIVAKFLTLFGREDIPVGIGETTNNDTFQVFWPWAKDYNLSQYRGGVYEDGIAKMAEIINASPDPVEIIAIGPTTNFPRLLKEFPEVAKKARVRVMGGSINSTSTDPEYNVAMCPECFNTTIHSSWYAPVSMAPTDTSGLVTFNITHMKQLHSSLNPLALGVANDLAYYCLDPLKGVGMCDWTGHYPIIFDPVATLLALPTLAEQWLVIKQLPIVVTSQGYTVVDDAGTLVDVAVQWQEPSGLSDFVQYLTDSLSNSKLQ